MPQAIHTIKGPFHAKIAVPGSKSITSRALLLAALADGVSEITNVELSEDSQILINALQRLGIVIQPDVQAHTCIVAGGNGQFPKKQATVWCADSITVAKYLLIACASAPGVYYFDGSTLLRNKSIAALLNILCRQGAQFIPNDTSHLPFTLMGADSFEGGEIRLDSSITSQLVSALLIIAPYARSPFNFTVVDLTSQPYIDMTCTMMAEFGVLVHRVHQGQFMVPVPQRYQARDYKIEPNLSLAIYFFAAAAITESETLILDVKRNQSKQQEITLLPLLEKMGCRIQETHAGLAVKGPAELQGIEVSMRDFSDAFLSLVIIAPFAKTPSLISHISTMRQNELNRMTQVKNLLQKMGINVEAGEDWLKIYPGTPQGGTYHCQGDPEVAMAIAILGLKVPGIMIENGECIQHHYPEFFQLLDKLSEQVSACA